MAVSDADGPLSHADGAQADADVIVIGAGPTGAACAFHLAYRGRRVLLLELEGGAAAWKGQKGSHTPSSRESKAALNGSVST